MRRLGLFLVSRGWEVEAWTTVAVDDLTWSAGFEAGSEPDHGIAVRRFAVVQPRFRPTLRRVTRTLAALPHALGTERLWAIAQGPYSPGLVTELQRAAPVATVFSPYLFHPILFGLPVSGHPRILVPAAHDEPPLRTALVGRAIVAADGLWFHSPEEAALVARVQPGAAAKPSECGVVGVDQPDGLDPVAFAAGHGITGPYLYYGGRASRAKGFELLVAGMELLRRDRPELTLVVSGEATAGPAVPWIRRLGWLDERERWEALAGAAAVVVPSALESLSLLALEAWSVGTPCLVNGAAAVLRGHIDRGGGGLAFRSPHELAAAGRRILDAPGLAAALGARGQAYVRATYRWDLAEERLVRLLAASAASPGPRSVSR